MSSSADTGETPVRLEEPRRSSAVATLRHGMVLASLVLLPALTDPFRHSPTLGFLFDVELGLLLTVTVLSIPLIPRLRRRPGRLPLTVATTLAAAMIVAVAVHPSPAGLAMTLVAVTGVGMAVTIADMDPSSFRRHVAAPLLALAAVEGAIMAAQWLTARPLLLAAVDPGARLVAIDGFLRPPGILMHVYQAAILGLVALAAGFVVAAGGARRWWTAGLAAAAATVGLTHSRSGLLGLLLAAAILWFVGTSRRRPSARHLVLPIAVGLLVSLLVAGGGWRIRLAQSAEGGLDDRTLGRVTLVEQSVRTIVSSPWIGVGPARYVDVGLARGDLDPRRPLPVHDLSLMVAAELGIPAAVLLTVLLVLLGIAAWRAGPRPAAAFAAVVPFLVFDVNLYDRPFGLVLLATWLGALALGLGSRRR